MKDKLSYRKRRYLAVGKQTAVAVLTRVNKTAETDRNLSECFVRMQKRLTFAAS